MPNHYNRRDEYPLSSNDVRAMLPQVGDRLMKVPKHLLYKPGQGPAPSPEPCVVEFVHTEHMWYRVRFERTGLTQCHMVPELKTKGGGL